MKLTERFPEIAAIKKKGYSFKFVMSLLIKMVVIDKKTVNASLPEIREHGITVGKDVFLLMLLVYKLTE